MPTKIVTDHDVIDIGGRQIEVLHTLGHSPGHLCFLEKTKDTYLLAIWYIKIYCLHTILLLTLKYILLHWTNRVINIDHQLLRDTEVGYYISTPKTGMRGRERNGPSTSCMDWIGMEKNPSIGRGIQNGYHCMNRIFWYHTTAVLSRMRSRLPCMRSRLDGIPF